MEEIRTKGIVIDTQDYKEYDKIITIFTYDMGVIKAVIKGVKKSNAKSRFAGQIFCFIDLILSKKGMYYTVISCDLVESFFEIAYKYESFLLAVDIVKVIKFISKYHPDSSELFVIFLSILNVLLKSDIDLNIVYLKFLYETLNVLGFKHSFKQCDKCHKDLKNNGYLDTIMGGVVCEDCKKKYSDTLNNKELLIINQIAKSKYGELATLNIAKDISIKLLKFVQLLFKINCNQ